MVQLEMPRRPAVLDAARADATIGDEDPAANAAVAHIATWVLMGVGDEIFADTDVTRPRKTVRTNRVDMTVHVQSRSPKFTLPGAPWRVYPLHERYHRDPLPTAKRYTKGLRTPIIRGLGAPVELRLLSPITEEIDPLPRGNLTDDDLGYVLGETSRAIRAPAAGEVGALRIEGPTDPLTHHVTIRHSALLVTASELDVTACEAAVGTLD